MQSSTSMNTWNPDTWFSDECVKCKNLQSEKLREFNKTIEDNKLWLENYIDKLISGNNSNQG